MKIVIDTRHCRHSAAFSDRCLAATIRNPLGHERPCMACLEDDGKPELTVVLIFDDGEEHTLILHNQLEREIAASNGWVAFVQPPEPDRQEDQHTFPNAA